jgi:hypothetical protein
MLQGCLETEAVAALYIYLPGFAMNLSIRHNIL